MKVIIDNKQLQLREKTTVMEYIRENNLEDTVLALKINNELAEQGYVFEDGDEVVSLTIGTDEGYMIYKESLILVLLNAAEQLYGYEPVIVRQSVNKSTYFEMNAKIGNPEDVAEELKNKMKEIISENKPLVQFNADKSTAVKLLKECGQMQLSEEIALLPSEKVKLCKTADRYHITYQALSYSVCAVANFDISVYEDGFLLRYPTNYTKTEIPPISAGRKIHRALGDYREWITTIGAGDIFSLNRFIRDGKGVDLVNLSEGLHEKRISRIADKIKENPAIKIILIAGPSSSGKTTFANRLCLHLRINHIEPVVISLDDYYHNDENMPCDANGEKDFEHVDAIDHKLFNEHLAKLAAGETVSIPKYDFVKRCRVKGRDISIHDGQIIIAEGIHALNELLTSKVAHENKYKIYLSALTSLCLDEYNAFSPTDNRLLRRIVRDAAYRNTTAQQTFDLWKNVRRGEKEYIFPFENEADEVFNSSLVYELAVLKKPALKLLDEVKKDSPHYSRARRLMELLSYFEEFDGSPIPPTSILREFIGGSTITH